MVITIAKVQKISYRPNKTKENFHSLCCYCLDMLLFVWLWEQKNAASSAGELLRFALSYADSNHDKQNQNLLCYHYTIRQSDV